MTNFDGGPAHVSIASCDTYGSEALQESTLIVLWLTFNLALDWAPICNDSSVQVDGLGDLNLRMSLHGCGQAGPLRSQGSYRCILSINTVVLDCASRVTKAVRFHAAAVLKCKLLHIPKS